MVKFLPSPCGKFIWVRAPFYLKDDIKLIPGRHWNKVEKVWEVPIENFREALGVFPGAMVHKDVQRSWEAMDKRNREAVALKNQSSVDVHVEGLKGKLYPFQAVGKQFLHLLRPREGAVLAFDMGLGR